MRPIDAKPIDADPIDAQKAQWVGINGAGINQLSINQDIPVELKRLLGNGLSHLYTSTLHHLKHLWSDVHLKSEFQYAP